MDDRYASLLHQFFDVPVAQRVSRIPADAGQDDFDQETHSFKIEYAEPPKFRWCSLPKAATAAAPPIRQNLMQSVYLIFCSIRKWSGSIPPRS